MMLATQTMLIGLSGGILGVLLGFAGIGLLNRLLPALDYGPAVAVAEPWFAIVGIVVALLLACITLPYVAYLGRSVAVTEAIK